MKKSIYLISFLALLGCSINVDFYIYNLSSKPITIIYEFKSEIIDGGFVSNPKILSFNRLTKLENVEDQNIIIDNEVKTITSSIGQGEALWIGNVTNYSKEYKNKRVQVYENLVNLRIIKNDSELNVSGEIAENLFKKVNQRHYGIIIK
jgi:hypothetical protein